jgi:hypothetical protein
VTLLDQIATLADTLTEPHFNRERYEVWDGNRHKKIRHHATVLPGLLGQLYQSVIPSSSSSGEPPASSIPASRPPLAVEALSCHDQISMGALAWCEELGLATRASVESNVRALVGAAGHLDNDQQKRLLADLRRWRGWSAVLVGWENVIVLRGSACPLPDCEQAGTLRVNLTAETAVCRACGATWTAEDGSIQVLGEHIKASTKTKVRV